ncbi:MAG: hypothetical protein ABUS48_06930 [Pseudomonadota bacterium]
MKKTSFALALALAACSPATTTTTSTAPQGLMEIAQAKSQEQLPVYGYTLLAAYQAAHADSTPKCAAVRDTASRGIIPPDVDPATAYGPYAGDLVISVQCGAQISNAPMDPHEHWLVVLAPGAADATIVNCANTDGNDTCPQRVPRKAVVATTTDTAAKAP